MHGWVFWAALAAELVALLLLWDHIRRSFKYSRRMADYKLRAATREYPPPFQPQDVLAAMIHARAKGDLVVSSALQERMWAEMNQRIAEKGLVLLSNEGWSRKVVPIR